MKLDYGRRCRLLDMRDNCYIKERLEENKVREFYKKIEEYKLDGFEVRVYELVCENMICQLAGDTGEHHERIF